MDENKAFDGDPNQLLAWHVTMGADEAIGDAPVNHFKEPETTTENASSSSKAGAKAASQAAANSTHQTKHTGAGQNLARGHATGQQTGDNAAAAAAAEHTAHECETLEALKAALDAFPGCPLKRTATKTVFGTGNPQADIMIIADPPGEAEDRSGEPFSGEPGQLFNKMMAAIGQSRDTDLYLSNIIPWRPPGGRAPHPHELATALPFVQRQISLVKPKVILLMGDGAYKFLTNDKKPIAKARGNWSTLTINNQSFDVLATYHPRYLLQQPLLKRDSWQDLQSLMQKLGQQK